MSTTPGKPIYRRPQKPETPPQNTATQSAIKGLSGMADYLADVIKTHHQSFSELGVYEMVRDGGTLLADAVARIESRK